MLLQAMCIITFSPRCTVLCITVCPVVYYANTDSSAGRRGGRVHYTHAPAEASDNRERSSALKFVNFYLILKLFILILVIILLILIIIH